MAQAQGTDFGYYAQLSEPELEVLDRALASIPDDILSTGERPSIESRIRRRLQEDGFLQMGAAGGPLGVADIPPIAFVGRAVGCLASNYVYLRGISQNKPPGEVAESIARAVVECVPGSIDAIKSDILEYRTQVARAFKALGLPALGDALCAVDAGGLYEMGYRDM
jgi:hypothetical protein